MCQMQQNKSASLEPLGNVSTNKSCPILKEHIKGLFENKIKKHILKFWQNNKNKFTTTN